MRVGQQPDPGRSPLVATPARKVSAVDLIYRGESILQIRGAITGKIYQFSSIVPVQSVDRRDAAIITQSRILRQTPSR
jgi:hypothetical protein